MNTDQQNLRTDVTSQSKSERTNSNAKGQYNNLLVK